MNLLFLTPQLPYPPRQGTTIRNYNLIRHLADRHTIDLLSFTAPGEELDETNALHQLCRSIATVPQPVRPLRQRALDTVRTPMPDMALRLEDATMHAFAEEWSRANRYDIVQMEGIEMAQYGLRFQQQGDPRPKLVFDDHNCEYLLQKRNAWTDLRQPSRWLAGVYSLIQWQKLRIYETHICRAADAVVAVSQSDRRALQELVPGREVAVVPNGIDVASLTPQGLDEATILQGGSPILTNPTLIFTGKMDYRPNIDAMLWFGRSVFPRIQMQLSSVRLQIVGMNPHPRLNELRENPFIEITGTVADTRPYIRAADVYVIPMRVGGGTRFKALEAMVSAKPIVSTSLGVEGIPVQHERELLLADSAEDFARSILRLLQRIPGANTLTEEAQRLRQQLGANAHRFVEAHYDWRMIIPELERLYAKII